MFYKIKALHETGSKIILHYFNYKPSRTIHEVEQNCSAIYDYQRKNLFQSQPLSSPFIVQSRINKQLIERLNQDDYPILLEGLHCSGIVPFLWNKERIVLRMHNEEASYYSHLAETERSLWKRKYFKRESRLLHRYQQAFDKKIKLACLSETDIAAFKQTYTFRQIDFIPCFTPWQQITGKEGKGEYCLYHGNLSVSENNKAACWLTETIFSQLQVPFVVAGRGASKELVRLASEYSHIRVVNNPTISEIDKLVQDAHINVLPSMNSTGVKLKLLNALLNGRHCITNPSGVMGSRIQKGVIIQNAVSDWIATIPALMQKEFSATEKQEREEILSLYDNYKNAQKLSALWTHCQ